MNGDGVIDMIEFSRWYFTGMKPYNNTRRTMMKGGQLSEDIINTMVNKLYDAM